MITIFTSCYNQGEYLKEAVESVLAQTYTDFEYLIYDDGSTDNTKDVLREMMNKGLDSRIKVSFLDKQPNVGAVINKSIEDMSGDVWVWLPADDIFKPHLLKEKAEWAKFHTMSVLYSNWAIIDKDSKFVRNLILTHISDTKFAEVIFNSCPVGCTGIWIPKDVFTKVGNFSEDLVCSEDYEWILRAVFNGVPFVHIPEILYSKRHHGSRITVRERTNIPEVVSSIRSMYK
jgi:glycosyltransferase involved in cell wall biosynthesis